MATHVKIKEERPSAVPSTRLPDPSALVCRKLMSCASLSLSALVEGSDAERAEKTQFYTLHLAKCHHSERFNLTLDADVFCHLMRSASCPLLVKVCELLNAYIKAAHIDIEVVDIDEGIRSSDELYAFYRRLHDDLVACVLPNLKAGEQCTLFICNLISICSSRRVFVNVVEDFGRSIRSLLPQSDNNESPVELSVDCARQVIGIMKTLLSLTKAFGAPPAPSKQLCDIASRVIRATKIHLCSLYSYNVIAFLLRKVNSEEEIKAALPSITAAQIKQVMALLKEANHLKDTYDWSFQHRAASPVVEHFATSITINIPESTSSSLSTQHISREEVDSMPAENNTFTPATVDRRDVESHDNILTAVVKDTSTFHTVCSHDNAKIHTGSTSSFKSSVDVTMTTVALPTPNDSSTQPFKAEWARMLVTQFVYSRHGAKASEYSRDAWKAKLAVLTNVIEQVERISGKLHIGPCTTQLITVMENILQFESAIPIIQSGLQLLYLLLAKSDDNLSRNGKAHHLFDLVYERLKDSNSKVQSSSIWCVAAIIKRSEGNINVDPIKRALMHKSPLARIAMCSIIAGSTALPEGACNISRDLQDVKAQLMPLMESLMTDKNIKVRNAAIDCKRALDDPSSVKVTVAVPDLFKRATPTKPATGHPSGTAIVNRVQSANRRNQNATTNSASAAEPAIGDKPSAEPTQSSASDVIQPNKRKLVRRFLKHSVRKHNKTNGDGPKLPPPEVPNERSGDETVTYKPQIVKETLPGSEAPLVEILNKYAIDSTVAHAKTDQNTNPELNTRASQERIIKPYMSATGKCLNYDDPISVSHAVDSASSNAMQRSSYEEVLLLNIPESILNKVSKRGSFRRCLPEGLYELWKWMQDHGEIATACETQILQFVRECTNNFREHSKSGKTAVWTFLEDFVSLHLSVETVDLLVDSLVSDITNAKATYILKLLVTHCDVNKLIVKILDGNRAVKSTGILSAVLEFVTDMASSAGVNNLISSTVDAIVQYCSLHTENTDSELAQLAGKLMDVLHLSPISCHTPELAKSHSIPPPQPISTSSADVESSGITTGPILQCFDIPEKFTMKMESASIRLQKSISKDLYDCMFQQHSIHRACQFWDTYLQDSKDTACEILFGAVNIRLELVVWLCHSLLLGISDGIVVRCLDHLFGMVNQRGFNLSHDEALLLIEALSLFYDRNAGDALLLFDHMMEITIVTYELINQCPSSCPWIDTMKDIVVPSDELADTDSATHDQENAPSPSPSTLEQYLPEASSNTLISGQESATLDIRDSINADGAINNSVPAIAEVVLTAAVLSPVAAPLTTSATSETRLSVNEVPDISSIAPEDPETSSISDNVDTDQLPPSPVDDSSVVLNAETSTDGDITDVSTSQNERCDAGTSPIPDYPVSVHHAELPIESSLFNGPTEVEMAAPCLLPDVVLQSTMLAPPCATADDTKRCQANADSCVLRRDETIDVELSPGTLPIVVTHSNIDPAAAALSGSLNAEEDEEDYGHYPNDVLASNDYQCKLHLQSSNRTKPVVTKRIEVAVETSSPRVINVKKMVVNIGIQTSPPLIEDIHVPLSDLKQLEVKRYDTQDSILRDKDGFGDSGNHRSYASSLVAESARTSISRILSQHINCGESHPSAESTALMERYMQLVEAILLDCSYIANICLLSNYQDYRTLLPSFYDDGMIDSCVERVRRILDNLTMFPDQHITRVLSPVLLDACHISILHLCKEIENFPQLSKLADKVVEVIVYLIELFIIASDQLDGRSLLQYCAVVIHCLALPKYCFHRNIRLYNGLSRLISVNALEQSTDVLSRLLVICLELSVQSLRRGDGGRILLAMLRLTKILQSQIVNNFKVDASMSPVARSELCKSHSSYMALLRDYLRGSTCKSTLEPRLNDALHQANALLHFLCEIM